MSLKVDSRHSRARSRSRTREKSDKRDRSNVRAPSPPEVVSEPRSSHFKPTVDATAIMPSMPGGFDDLDPIRSPRHDDRGRDGYMNQSYAHGSGGLPYPTASPFPGSDSHYARDDAITMGNWTDFPPHERPGYVRQQSDHQNDLAYGSSQHPDLSRQRSSSFAYPPTYGHQDPNYQQPGTDYSQTRHMSYAPQPTQYQYASPPDKITYTARPNMPKTTSYGSASSQHKPSSSLGITSSMGRLFVSGGSSHHAGGGVPPPSPLLEAYHGTYQSVSPMVAPMALPGDSDLSDLEPLSAPSKKGHKSSSSKSERRGSKSHHEKDKHHDKDKDKSKKDEPKEKKHVKLYDAEEDARALAAALSHSKIDSDVVCEILPTLSNDQMLELRSEYKKHAKVQGRGINIAKHIKLKLSGNFGKAAYVVALARWEGEGYWANFFYQSHGSRRELLIESLVGRPNAEIRHIKDEFRDKRYGDDLKRCMEKELKADKFRTAILMVLEGKRQEETEVYPVEYRNRDVDILNRCMRAKEGGETAMLEIILKRSDTHLRDVLQTYERMHGANFAREALKKSNNLVGEIIAHILNGVINRPARDALLLHHAIADIATHNKEDELRYELLISRLVRFHWDRMHMLRVRKEYLDKYKTSLEDDIEDATKGDFREFMLELCQGSKQ